MSPSVVTRIAEAAVPESSTSIESNPPGDGGQLAPLMDALSPREPRFAVDFVDRLLRLAADARASDVHLDPTGEDFAVRWRLDGVLHPLGRSPKSVAPNVIARLKVLAGLLTYETALPQEGRLRDEAMGVEVRVSTFPSLFGERAVLRLLGTGDGALDELPALGLPAHVLDELQNSLAATTGAILVVGPAGSGKTTTAYACLRHVATQSSGGRSIASLEDPIEAAVDGVAQSQVNPAAGFDMATGLRSLLRLDPEVIFIGEMRDRATADIALQAALTGQLVVTTFHAGQCADALNRLSDMGVTSYAVQHAVRLVVAQRLERRLCDCAQTADPEQSAKPLGIRVSRCWSAGACQSCRGTGYRGRCLVAEWQVVGGRGTGKAEREAVEGTATPALRSAPSQDLWTSAESLVEAGVTSPLEVIRVLGFRSTAS